jgi:hypothetical protein
MKKPLKSIIDYLVLTMIVSVAVILTLYFNGSKNIQEIIIITLSALYIVWGVIHHLRENTLQARVVLEYVLFALLGSVLVIGLLR